LLSVGDFVPALTIDGFLEPFFFNEALAYSKSSFLGEVAYAFLLVNINIIFILFLTD